MEDSTGLDSHYTGPADAVLWGPQLTESPSVMPWVGSLSGASAFVGARVDHSPATGVGRGLLLEAAGSNVQRRSADLGHADWTKNGITLVEVAEAKSPTGRAWNFVEEAGTGNHRIYTANAARSTLVTGEGYVSVRAKMGTRRYMRIDVRRDRVLIGGAVFDLQAGTSMGNWKGGGIRGPVKGALTMAGDGWWDCRIHLPGITSNIFYVFHIFAGNAMSGVTSYAGVAGDVAIQVAAAQLENGNRPLSWLPTFDAARTRDADAAVVPRLMNTASGAVELSYARDVNDAASAPLVYLGAAPAASWLYTSGAADMVTTDGVNLMTSMDADNDDIEAAVAYAIHYHDAMMDHVEGGAVVATAAFDGAMVGNGDDGLGLGHGGGVTRIEKLNIWDLAPGAALLEGETAAHYTVGYDFDRMSEPPAWLDSLSTDIGFVWRADGEYGTVGHNLFDHTRVPEGGSWVLSGLTITAGGRPDPNGAMEAIRAYNTGPTRSAAGSMDYTLPAHPGGPLSISFYAKADRRTGAGHYLMLRVENSANAADFKDQYFTADAVGAAHGTWVLIRHHAVAMGGATGWRRYSATFDMPQGAVVKVKIFPSVVDSSGLLRGDQLPDIDLWRPQAEIRAMPGEWRGEADGTGPVYEPRIDWNPQRMPSGGALLCRGLRENDLGNSENPTADALSVWGTTGGTIRERQDSWRGIVLHEFEEDAATSQHGVDIQPNLSQKGKWTASAYLQSQGRRFITVEIRDGAAHVAKVVLDRDSRRNPAVTETGSGSVAKAFLLSDSSVVWRVSLTIDNTSVAASSPLLTIRGHNVSGDLSLAGAGARSLRFGGVQVENEGVVSNYIETWAGTARNHEDSAHIVSVPTYIGADRGTVIAWTILKEIAGGNTRQTVFCLRRSNGNLIECNFNTDKWQLSRALGGSRPTSWSTGGANPWMNLRPATPIAVDTLYKVAAAWAPDDWRLTVGVETLNETSAAVPLNMTRLDLGHNNERFPLLGEIQRLRVYDRRLTQAEILAVT